MAFRFGLGDEVHTSTIAINTDASDVLRVFDLLPNAADQSAKGVSGAFSAEFNKISAGAAALAAGIGGPIGQVASLANSALRPLAEVNVGLGAVAVGALGAAAGVSALVGLAGGMISLSNAAGEAGDRLIELDLLTDAESESAREMAAAIGAAEVAQDQLTFQLAESITVIHDAGSAWAGFKSSLAESVSTIADITGGTVEWRHEMQEAVPVIGDMVRWLDESIGPGQGNLGIVGSLNALWKESAASGREMALAVDDTRIALIKLIDEKPVVTVHFDEGGGAAAVRNHLLMDETAALEDVAEGERQNAQAKLAAAEAARQATDAERAHTAALKEEAAQHDLVMATRIQNFRFAAEARDTAADDEIADIVRVRNADSAANDELEGEIEDIMLARQAAAADWEQSVKDARDRAIEYELQTVGTILGGIETITDATVQQYQDRVAAGETLSVAEVKQANAAIEASKILGIAQAGISSALAGAGIIANLAPFLGLAAIPIGVSAGAGLFFASVAAIETGSPLQFEYSGAGGEASSGAQGRLVDDHISGNADELVGGGTAGAKGENAEKPLDFGARTTGGGVTIGLDPRMKSLLITSNGRVGKRARRI